MLGRFAKTPPVTARARHLRRNATDVEKQLWQRLRGGQVAGVSFRRQYPIGTYVADFCALSQKLIVELDGSQHADDQDIKRDDARSQWLNAQGFRVLRFWNRDIVDNIGGVVEEIARVLAEKETTPT
jgi:very-short-patch-repair endonuclease